MKRENGFCKRAIQTGWLMLLFLLSGCESNGVEFSFVSYCSELIPASNITRSGEDELLGYQWYLERIGIQDLWDEGMTGEGVHISILDDALDLEHEDLTGNVLRLHNRNYLERADSSRAIEPLPIDCVDDGHGTSVAGIIAAVGNNNVGIKGIAFNSKIYFSNYLSSQNIGHLIDALGSRTPQTAVSSNSWGGRLHTRLRSVDRLTRTVIQEGVKEGYGGKGVSYVFAAGNARNFEVEELNAEDMATYEELLNQQEIISVCAVNAQDKVASYSTPGTNLWICAPSGDDEAEKIIIKEQDDTLNFAGVYAMGLPTTDLSGGAGDNSFPVHPTSEVTEGGVFDAQKPTILQRYLDFGWGDFHLSIEAGMQNPNVYSNPDNNNRQRIEREAGNSDYTRFFDGTSAATPVVSGTIALLRSRYPDLTWRDIKLILAESAEQIDAESLSWQIGKPAYHNESRNYTYNIDYGFGLVNATVARELAADDWQPVPDQKDFLTGENNIALSSSAEGVIEPVSNRGIDFIEYIQVFIETDYHNFGAMAITLESPNGIKSALTREHLCLEWAEDLEVDPVIAESCPDLEGGFTFGTAAHLGESPVGRWTLKVKIGDFLGNDDLNWQLHFYGH